MQTQTNYDLQSLLLCAERAERIPVTVFLMNGFQMRGEVAGFDGEVLILESDGRQQMIYKHAISTIAPVRPVPLP